MRNKFGIGYLVAAASAALGRHITLPNLKTTGAPAKAQVRQIGSNRLLPKEVQERIIAKAQAKRERKMLRPNGWYNG